VFSASMTDIKSLNLTEEDWPEDYTLWSLSWVLNVFDHDDWEVAALKREGTDHQIKLKVNEKSQKYSEVLYTTWQERLLVLQDINRTLNKQFIQVSNSSAAVSVLFVQKSEGELQFCVNYCDLNWITQKNHYSLSLIYETLQNIRWAQWYIKLNVIAAFHKIQIAAEDKWKTAFHMRYRLYEWMMTSFELAMSWASFKDILTEPCRTFWISSVQSMWTIFSFSLMNCCINTEIMYERYYYDFEKSAYKLTLTNVSLKSSQSSI
jgi:hypothetical protein